MDPGEGGKKVEQTAGKKERGGRNVDRDESKGRRIQEVWKHRKELGGRRGTDGTMGCVQKVEGQKDVRNVDEQSHPERLRPVTEGKHRICDLDFATFEAQTSHCSPSF